MIISQWLRHAADELKSANVPSNRLDAELILADTLHCERIYLHAHGDLPLTAKTIIPANAKLQTRKKRTPLAYILGRKDFYGRTFAVTPDVLVPRPETETLIGLAEALDLPPSPTIADIGTGSGAIAITLKLNQPARRVIATDMSTEALRVAQENARNFDAEIVFLQGNLAAPLPTNVDVIIANLPYVDPAWERSPETSFEPELALFAADHGLALIEELLAQIPHHLAENGFVALEADPQQHTAIIKIADQNSLRHIRTEGYGILLQRRAAMSQDRMQA